jgi:hypothetical protein
MYARYDASSSVDTVQVKIPALLLEGYRPTFTGNSDVYIIMRTVLKRDIK